MYKSTNPSQDFIEKQEEAMRVYDILTRTLEVIAIGESNDPMADAISALVDAGFWKK